jgi:Rubisco LSMT substrate-binding
MSVTKGTLKARRGVGFSTSVVEEVAKRFGGNKSSARTALADLCRSEMDGMATTTAEDEELLLQALSRNEQLAVAYRLEKKRVLVAAAEAMNSLVTS